MLALERLDPADHRLAWLFSAGKPPRQKVLEELARIAVLDEESCYLMGVEVCARRPRSTHEGAAWLRHRRLGHDERGDPRRLRDAILRAVRRFQQGHPRPSYATIITALREYADEWEAAWHEAQATG